MASSSEYDCHNNEYRTLRAGLQTGLQMPAQPYWLSCTVVVVRGPEDLADARMRRRLLRLQRPGPWPDRVRVVLSREELENGEECLWPQVTALVPFADWDRLVIRRKVRAPRRRVMTDSTIIFNNGTPVNGVSSEVLFGRNIMLGLQDNILQSVTHNAAAGEYYTLVLYTR
jgi:hypothetical protein